jgi:TATA-box binding protein (TBP) (component of TFIID and TFIIIB)
MEALAAEFAGVLVKSPAVSAITCAFTANEEIDYGAIDKRMADLLLSSVESEGVVLNTALTKKKSQVCVPLPVYVGEHVVFYRVRWQEYVRNQRTRANFMNQCCFFFHTHDGRSKCFKVFRNGVVHVTGFTDVNAMTACTTEFVNKLVVWAGAGGGAVSWKERNIYLMNASFRMHCALTLQHFHRRVLQSGNWDSVYEPEMYCGVMIDAGRWKANVFRTGSVIITGVKCMEDLIEGTRSMIKYIHDYHALWNEDI